MKNVGKNQEKQLKREEKARLKEEQKARQNEQPQIKDVSDFTEVPQERDIQFMGILKMKVKVRVNQVGKSECSMQRIVRITS